MEHVSSGAQIFLEKINLKKRIAAEERQYVFLLRVRCLQPVRQAGIAMGL